MGTGENMTGTIVNAAAILCGGAVGLVVKKGIRRELSESCMKVVGLCTFLIGLTSTLRYMLSVGENGAIESNGSLLLLVSLVTGTLIGELLHIEDGIEKLSGWAERTFRLDGFSKGFVTASILFCVGAMAVMGAFNDGLAHDPGLLYVKSMMDGISSIFLASTLGFGVLAAAVPVLLYQGGLTLAAGLLAPFFAANPSALNAMCMVGFVMIIAIALNLMGLAKFKTSNMLPALLVVMLADKLPWF